MLDSSANLWSKVWVYLYWSLTVILDKKTAQAFSFYDVFIMHWHAISHISHTRQGYLYS